MSVKDQSDETIFFRLVGVDQNSGALLVQFSDNQGLPLIDQSTVHAFFPWQYGLKEIEDLLPYISDFGKDVLSHSATMTKNKFLDSDVEYYKSFIGKDMPVKVSGMNGSFSDTYNPDSRDNPNSNIDEIRCIVLEILAEEGLIS